MPTTTSSSAALKTMARLPSSDVLMYVEVKRLLTDIVPRALAGNSARQTQINADLDKFKTTTGVDPRSIEHLAVGTKLVTPSPNVTRAETVMVAQGTFSAPAIVAAGRLAAQGKYREEKYNDKTIYIFSLNEQIKMLGLLRINVGDLAFAALDAGTLAIGTPQNVRNCLDANAATNAKNNNDALTALATRNANAFIGFGGNLPASFAANLNLGNEEITRNIASVKQFYGSIGTTANNNYDVLTVLRTDDAARAQDLSDTLGALKQFAPLLASQLPAPRGKVAQALVDSLQIVKEGSEVQIKLPVAQTDLTTLLGNM